MTDNKSNKGGQDRSKVAGGQDYEVNYLAKELGVSTDKIKAAIKAVGNDRKKIKEYLKK